MEKVTIIGTGKVALSFIKAFHSLGILHEVYGRNDTVLKSIKKEYSYLHTTSSLGFTRSDATFFIICVSDSAIDSITKNASFPLKATVVHTSGSIPIEVLSNTVINHGIFYPLQTFSPVTFDSLKAIPILIESSNYECQSLMLKLAKSISNQVQLTSQTDRQRLHVAAVFASNFTNRMIHAANLILKDTSLPLSILESLAHQSIANAFDQGPQNSLTGPAQRNDQSTIQSHISQLDDNSELQAIYKSLTHFISININ